ncbi:MAG: hypothetical protein R3E86_06330 [Pseudomonadales bacterium]
MAARLLLRTWGLRQLRSLARESEAVRRCWSVIERMPAGLLSQPLRMTLGKIMYVRLKRAMRVQPEHPFLVQQQLQIARFIGSSMGGRRGEITRAAREDALQALGEFLELLDESRRADILREEEMLRCRERVIAARASLQLDHFRQAAIQAECLRQMPQAISYLRDALKSAESLQDRRAYREIREHLHDLETAAGF